MVEGEASRWAHPLPSGSRVACRFAFTHTFPRLVTFSRFLGRFGLVIRYPEHHRFRIASGGAVMSPLYGARAAASCGVLVLLVFALGCGRQKVADAGPEGSTPPGPEGAHARGSGVSATPEASRDDHGPRR